MRRTVLTTVMVLSLTLLTAGITFSSGMNNYENGMNRESGKTLFHGTVPVDKLTGMKVMNREGETIGKVTSQKLDTDGMTRFLTISTGGFMGIGETEHLIPVSAFKPNERADALILNVDEDLLANAPEKSSGMDEERFDRELYEHYGQAPYWGDEKEHAKPFDPGPQDSY